MKSHGLYLLLICLQFSSGCKTEVDFGNPPRPDYDPLRDANIKPLVVETYPLHNSQGPYENFGTIVQLRFNKVMDITTLRQAVHLSSSLGDVRINPNTIATSDEVTFLFEAVCYDSPARFWWKVGEEYTLTVDSAARDINKNNIVDGFSIKFLPEPNFRVVEISPANSDTNVSPIASPGFLRIEFNSEVDSTIFSAVHISPEMIGNWHLEDPTHMFYHLYQDLDLKGMYTLAVDATAIDKFGHHILESVSSSFTAQSFQVIETFPLNGEGRIPPTGSIGVHFNSPIDTGSVRASFSCSPALAGNFVFEERQFYYSPAFEMRTSADYTITLRQTLSAVDGHHLTPDYVFKFTTDRFRVVTYSPAHLSENVSRLTPIYVQCNARIDYSSLLTAFSTYPPIQGTFEVCPGGNCSGFEFLFVLSDTLAPNTVYAISAGVMSNNGVLIYPLRSMTGDRTFERWYFRTGDK